MPWPSSTVYSFYSTNGASYATTLNSSNNKKGPGVWIGKLSPNTSDALIRKLCHECGQVTKYSRTTNPATNTASTFAVVEFSDGFAAIRAANLLNNIKVDGSKWLVKADAALLEKANELKQERINILREVYPNKSLTDLENLLVEEEGQAISNIMALADPNDPINDDIKVQLNEQNIDKFKEWYSRIYRTLDPPYEFRSSNSAPQRFSRYNRYLADARAYVKRSLQNLEISIGTDRKKPSIYVVSDAERQRLIKRDLDDIEYYLSSTGHIIEGNEMSSRALSERDRAVHRELSRCFGQAAADHQQQNGEGTLQPQSANFQAANESSQTVADGLAGRQQHAKPLSDSITKAAGPGPIEVHGPVQVHEQVQGPVKVHEQVKSQVPVQNQIQGPGAGSAQPPPPPPHSSPTPISIPVNTSQFPRSQDVPSKKKSAPVKLDLNKNEELPASNESTPPPPDVFKLGESGLEATTQHQSKKSRSVLEQVVALVEQAIGEADEEFAQILLDKIETSSLRELEEFVRPVMEEETSAFLEKLSMAVKDFCVFHEGRH